MNPKGLVNLGSFIELKNLYNQLLKRESEAFASLDACLGNDEQFKTQSMENDLFPKAPLSTSLRSSGDFSLGWLDGEIEDTSSGSNTSSAATPAPIQVLLTQEQEEKLNELKTLRALLNTKWTPALNKEVLEHDSIHEIS